MIAGTSLRAGTVRLPATISIAARASRFETSRHPQGR